MRGDTGAADHLLAEAPRFQRPDGRSDRSAPTLAPFALRGEVLCAAGRPAEGLPILQASIDAIAPMQSPASPALARLRALAGRCSLTLGRRAGCGFAGASSIDFAGRRLRPVNGWPRPASISSTHPAPHRGRGQPWIEESRR